MSAQAYVGTAQRTFQQALIHRLETDYALLGSRRVLELLADDVQRLVDEFYPVPQRLSSGWMVFAGTKAVGPKPHPGQSASQHTLVTLAWPVLLPEDLQQLATLPETPQARREWWQRRLVRLVEYGWQHPDGPVLLTLADLAAMLGLTTGQVSPLLQEARRATGKPLPTKGYYFDQGMRPTHKGEIIALYEQGVDEAEIARRSGHASTSVGHYLRDYERVKLLLKRSIPVEQMPALLDLQPNVVRAYVDMVRKYHPNQAPETVSSP